MLAGVRPRSCGYKKFMEQHHEGVQLQGFIYVYGDGGQRELSQLDYIIGPKNSTTPAISAMKESCGTRGIITRFMRGIRNEEMLKHSRGNKRRIGAEGDRRQKKKKSSCRK